MNVCVCVCVWLGGLGKEGMKCVYVRGREGSGGGQGRGNEGER